MTHQFNIRLSLHVHWSNIIHRYRPSNYFSCLLVKLIVNFYILSIYDFIIFSFILSLRYYVLPLIRYTGWLYYLGISFQDTEKNIVKHLLLTEGVIIQGRNPAYSAWLLLTSPILITCLCTKSGCSVIPFCFSNIQGHFCF